MAPIISLVINGFLLLQVLTLCNCDDAVKQNTALKSEAEEMGERQIFSPRMGKDVPAEAAEKLYVRIPPLPKLGKTFDAYLNQYRREDDEGNDDEWRQYEMQASAGDSSNNKRAVSMLRMGKRAGVSMLRMGKKSADESEEFDRDQRAVSMLRMGRASASSDGEEAKRAVSMLRMGRSESADKRAVSMLRMGRSEMGDKRAVSMLRMGRSGSDDNKRAVSMLRMG